MRPRAVRAGDARAKACEISPESTNFPTSGRRLRLPAPSRLPAVNLGELERDSPSWKRGPVKVADVPTRLHGRTVALSALTLAQVALVSVIS